MRSVHKRLYTAKTHIGESSTKKTCAAFQTPYHLISSPSSARKRDFLDGNRLFRRRVRKLLPLQLQQCGRNPKSPAPTRAAEALVAATCYAKTSGVNHIVSVTVEVVRCTIILHSSQLQPINIPTSRLHPIILHSSRLQPEQSPQLSKPQTCRRIAQLHILVLIICKITDTTLYPPPHSYLTLLTTGRRHRWRPRIRSPSRNGWNPSTHHCPPLMHRQLFIQTLFLRPLRRCMHRRQGI